MIQTYLKKEHNWLITILDLIQEKHIPLLNDFLNLKSEYQRLTFLVKNDKAIWCFVSENDIFKEIANTYSYKNDMNTIQYVQFIRIVEQELSKYSSAEKQEIAKNVRDKLRLG